MRSRGGGGGDGDSAAAGADVGDEEGRSMLRPYGASRNQLDGSVDEGLGLGAGDEGIRRDQEVEAVELAVAGDVGGGLAGEAALEVGLEAGGGRLVQGLVEVGEEVGAGNLGDLSPLPPLRKQRGGSGSAESVAQEKLCFQVGVLDAGGAQAVPGLVEGVNERHRRRA